MVLYITKSNCSNAPVGSKKSTVMVFKQNGQSVTYGVPGGQEEYTGTLNGYTLDSYNHFNFDEYSYDTTSHVTYAPEYKKISGKYEKTGISGECSFKATISGKKK